MNTLKFLRENMYGGIKWDLEFEKRINNPKFLESFGYKVYSQNDEDGIINEIFKRIGISSKIFVEFGVDIGIESNCHSLLLQGWNGLWIEGRKEAYTQILRRFAPVIREGHLSVLNTYVMRDNINRIIKEYTKDRELDLLSIDVDGNDWHIWNAITDVQPRVVAIEYNAKFPPEINWKMAYNEHHMWDGSDRHGASLKALEVLGKEKGYQLVATNFVGVNAFFVRCDLAKDLFAVPATTENLYNPARYSRVGHFNGHPGLNYVSTDIEGMQGVFEYYPDWNFLGTYGFWKIEVYDNYRKLIMSQKKAQMFARFIPTNAKEIQLIYFLNVPIEILKSDLEVSVSVDDGDSNIFIITETSGYLQIPLNKTYEYEELIKIELRTNLLWIPDLLIHNNDIRKQGICIKEIRYE